MKPASFPLLTRRTSLIALSTAGMTALLSSLAADGKNRRRKRRRKGAADKLCQRQVGQCVEFLTPQCAGEADCLADIQTCCLILGSCQFARFALCFEAID